MDSPALRQLLVETWGRSAQDAAARGVSARAIADTMLEVAVGILQEAAGPQGSAAHLAEVARRMAAQAEDAGPPPPSGSPA